jgi:hypothetical protein
MNGEKANKSEEQYAYVRHPNPLQKRMRQAKYTE